MTMPIPDELKMFEEIMLDIPDEHLMQAAMMLTNYTAHRLNCTVVSLLTRILDALMGRDKEEG
jgi:hypothetical protein